MANVEVDQQYQVNLNGFSTPYEELDKAVDAVKAHISNRGPFEPVGSRDATITPVFVVREIS